MKELQSSCHHHWHQHQHQLGSRSSRPSQRLLVKCGILVNLVISSLIILTFINSSNLTGASSITRKPPFNGSIFGKRSSVPPMRPPQTPEPFQVALDDSLYPTAPTGLPGRRGPDLDMSGYYVLALYPGQLQQEQRRESAIAQAAIKRCLTDRELAATLDMNKPNACDELLSFVLNLRTRLN